MEYHSLKTQAQCKDCKALKNVHTVPLEMITLFSKMLFQY